MKHNVGIIRLTWWIKDDQNEALWFYSSPVGYFVYGAFFT